MRVFTASLATHTNTFAPMLPDAAAPFTVAPMVAAQAARAASHALTPAELLRVYRQLNGGDAPPCTLLAIRGERFGLGQPLSDAASSNLDAALRRACGWVGVA